MKESLTRSEQIAIYDAVVAGIRKTSHHKSITSRVYDAIRVELGKINGNPDAWVVSRGNLMYQDCITVWGPKGYDTRITFYGRSTHQNTPDTRTWSEGLLQGALVLDERDVLEREALEASRLDLHAHFERAEKKIVSLLAEIESERAIAASLIARLPVPVAAKVRLSPAHWGKPSKPTAEKYPNLFNK